MKPNIYIHTPLNVNKKLFLGSVPGGSPGVILLSNLIVRRPAQAERYSYAYSKKSKADYEHEYEWTRRNKSP